MQKLTGNNPEREFSEIIADNLSQLQGLFPEAFSDGKVQIDVLQQLLGVAVDDSEEKFGLNWHGKRRARQIALTPSNGTLTPCRDDSLNWNATQNLFIEGDNLEVLKLLQKGYASKVKIIYIDPPYNTGKDFVYRDDFRNGVKNYLEQTGQVEDGKRLSSNPETSGRFHSDWLSMMYPRIRLAKNLLSQDGVIFITLDDCEVANMRLIMDEIFGTECFVSSVAWKKRSSPDARDTIGSVHDWILVYVKNADLIKSSIGKMPLSQERIDSYANPDNDKRGAWASVDMTGMTGRATAEQYYEVTLPSGRVVTPPEGRAWGISKETFNQLLAESRIWFGKSGDAAPRIKRFLSESDGQVVPSLWSLNEVGSNEEAKKEVNKLFGMADVFDTPKPVRLIRRILEISTKKDSGHIVMDFFAGSGTTGHAVMSHNREMNDNLSYILVQLPEIISGEIKTQTAAARYCKEAGIKSNIAALAQQRLRLVNEEESALEEKNDGKHGFKVFKLSESNFKPWNASHESLQKTIIELENNVREDSTEEDLMYELLIKTGIPLSTEITERRIENTTVISVAKGVVYLYLKKIIEHSTVEDLANNIVTLRNMESPGTRSRLYVRSDAFINDVDLLNFSSIIEQTDDFEVYAV